MELHIVGKNNLELTPPLKEYVRKKIDPIDERFRKITIANVVLHIDKFIHTAEITVHFNGHEIHASAQGKDLYEAIDIMSDRIYAQLTKQKERDTDSHH